MRNLVAIFILTILSIQFVSCQTNTVKTTFVSTLKDTATGLKERKIYRLKKQATSSDFNYTKLNNIDDNLKDTLNLRNIMPVFEPVDGQYKYFQFMATCKGEGYNADGPPLIKDFHDILIIKTDPTNIILDAYHYTIEWGEIPCQYDVYKISAKNVVLTDSFQLQELNLLRTYAWDENDKILIDDGLVRLK